ncbi:MAG: SOS response-associated peptidase [Ignavibacteriae bacterium]|nr:SOS response-associated peptidase [Ignavibacteriota bacterium]
MCYNSSVVDDLPALQNEFPVFKSVKDKDAFDGIPFYNALRLQHLPIFGMREKELRAFKAMWWLIPHWSKSGKPESTSFNARIETIDSSRLFAPYFKASRCLFPVRAFFEYSPKEIVSITTSGKVKKVKQPYVFQMRDDMPFMMAGIFSVWINPNDGKELPSFAVITTTPNSILAPIHDRMPVILDRKYFELWLDRDFNETNVLKDLCTQPFPASKMKMNKVSAEYLYNRANNDVRCWEKAI